MIKNDNKTISSVFSGKKVIKKIYRGTLKVYEAFILPKEYQRVEYIESTRKQYIDTGVVPSTRLGVYVDFTSTQSGTLFGAITDVAVGYYGVNLSFRDNVGTFEPYWGASLGRYGSWEYNTRYQLEFNYLNSNKLVVDGQEIKKLSTTPNLTTNNIHLFKLNGGATQFEQYIGAKLYGVKMIDGETLIRDFIPCYRKSDNVVGLYDLVNDVFYTNKGTGTFYKGNDVL